MQSNREMNRNRQAIPELPSRMTRMMAAVPRKPLPLPYSPHCAHRVPFVCRERHVHSNLVQHLCVDKPRRPMPHQPHRNLLPCRHRNRFVHRNRSVHPNRYGQPNRPCRPARPDVSCGRYRDRLHRQIMKMKKIHLPERSGHSSPSAHQVVPAECFRTHRMMN